ncbi:hypothetical protein K469DRAFT_606263 [Zopfia rhizophila CBS 207.26]|uniref:UBX domain-containing protein n=1 Tax=Zopfia rhizophila CBS 207.26 TaxID=1314779 RepID=A0A6A6DAZ2_9PEZI|nr:hypothetical protein K469DRAFT_606263 [Zopfia rhizophila CBS 207.26]
MTSHVVVVGSTARTVKIPTTPAKYLTEVRDEACKKFNLSPDQFTLKYNNKPISLSQQIRLANLPQGARLELVQSSRSPSVISVALQLPESEKNIRLTQKFASNTSLWEILRQFESGSEAHYNFTQRGVPEMSTNGSSGAGRLNYEMPVITVMPGHQEQSSFVGLQQTLSQLGFDNGSALLRLGFKNSGTPLEEAMTEISLYFKSSVPTPSGAHADSSEQARSIPDSEKAAPEASEVISSEAVQSEQPDPKPMEVDSTPVAEPTVRSSDTSDESSWDAAPSATESSVPPAPSTSSTSTQPSMLSRNVQIFSPPTSATPQAARRAFNEMDYEPTIEHAKAHQAALQARTRNQRLLSDKELAEQENARLERLNAAAEKGGSLRIRMPDQTMIQMDITKSDTAEVLYEFVKGFLEFKNQPFQLKYIGPKGTAVLIPRDKKRLIQDLRFSGREVVTFIWDEKASNEARLSRKTLSKEWQDKAQMLKVEEPAVEEKPGPAVQSKSEGKRKVFGSSSADKESKLKNILGKGLFKR